MTNKTQKSVIIKDYIQGFASYLDENNIRWEHLGHGVADWIRIYYTSEDELFRIAFEFGKFYMEVES
jgi:hypothetical protein